MSNSVKRVTRKYTKEYKLEAIKLSEVCKEERMMLIAIKTENGKFTGEIVFYCRVLKVSRQGFYSYLESLKKPWKYEALAAKMKEIIDEDECNDTYGRYRMQKALELKKEAEDDDFPHIPCERTVYRIMERLDIAHTPKRKPNGITKADREAMKSDDKIKRDFTEERPLEKAVTDITEVQTADGKALCINNRRLL